LHSQVIPVTDNPFSVSKVNHALSIHICPILFRFSGRASQEEAQSISPQILQQEIQLIQDQLHSTKLLLHRLSADQEYIQYKQKVLCDNTIRIDEPSLAATSDIKKTNLNASAITPTLKSLYKA
jgi:hypothetical protein